MRIFSFRRSYRGFTLVELAIVLAVAGLMFTGLFRLLSGGNQQIKDSATASQQAQLISATKSFLSSPDGQGFLAASCTAATGGVCTAGTTVFNLPLPSSSTPAGGTSCYSSSLGGTDTNLAGATISPYSVTWCNSLPPGFSAATTNSYGQVYNIQVMANSATVAGAGQAPTTYSFMILTSAGDIIVDSSGGRISSQIGGDGGFIYTTSVCGAGNACGSYGAWSAPVTGANSYGFAAALDVAGNVASRTYVSPEQDSNLPWLARNHIASDTPTAAPSVKNPTTNYNTMSMNIWLNKSGIYENGFGTALDTIYGTGSGGYGGRIIDINQIVVGNNDAEYPFIAPPAGPASPPTNFENAALILNGPVNGSGAFCIAQQAQLDEGGYTQFTDGTNICHPVLQINGNQLTTGMVQANILWASSFIYGTQSSDLRIKKDIKPLGGALDNIMKLKPVTYRLKQDNKEDIGFIAQDLQKVYPQIVIGRPDGILGVNYMGLLAPLVSAVQELKKENDDLRKQLHAEEITIKKFEKNNLTTK